MKPPGTLSSIGLWLLIGYVAYAVLSGMLQDGPLYVSQTAGADSVELRRAGNGHYFVEGEIDGHALTFMVDTGASSVAISAAVADRLGLKRCRPVQASTANGIAVGCLTRVGALSFGGMTVRGVTVNVLPNLRGPALLGMNVLEHFRIEQQGGIMRISRVPRDA